MTKELILSLIPGASEEQAGKFIKYYADRVERKNEPDRHNGGAGGC